MGKKKPRPAKQASESELIVRDTLKSVAVRQLNAYLDALTKQNGEEWLHANVPLEHLLHGYGQFLVDKYPREPEPKETAPDFIFRVWYRYHSDEADMERNADFVPENAPTASHAKIQFMRAYGHTVKFIRVEKLDRATGKPYQDPNQEPKPVAPGPSLSFDGRWPVPNIDNTFAHIVRWRIDDTDSESFVAHYFPGMAEDATLNGTPIGRMIWLTREQYYQLSELSLNLPRKEMYKQTLLDPPNPTR